jgi:hypothetical protein
VETIGLTEGYGSTTTVPPNSQNKTCYLSYRSVVLRER